MFVAAAVPSVSVFAVGVNVSADHLAFDPLLYPWTVKTVLFIPAGEMSPPLFALEEPSAPMAALLTPTIKIRSRIPIPASAFLSPSEEGLQSAIYITFFLYLAVFRYIINEKGIYLAV